MHVNVLNNEMKKREPAEAEKILIQPMGKYLFLCCEHVELNSWGH